MAEYLRCFNYWPPYSLYTTYRLGVIQVFSFIDESLYVFSFLLRLWSFKSLICNGYTQ